MTHTPPQYPDRRPQGRGFTLVELLVVIGIIALLVSILLPTLNRARATAQSVKCLANMRQHATAVVFYANDFNGYAVPHTVASRNTSGLPGWDGPSPDYGNWEEGIFSDTIYLGQYTGEEEDTQSGQVGDDEKDESMWYCPSANVFEINDDSDRITYGMPMGRPDDARATFGWAFVTPQNLGPNKPTPWSTMFRLSRIEEASKFVATVDAADRRFIPTYGGATRGDLNFYALQNTPSSIVNYGTNNPDSIHNHAARHNDYTVANFSFADGHAQSMQHSRSDVEDVMWLKDAHINREFHVDRDLTR